VFFVEQKDFLSQQEKYNIDSTFWSTDNPWTYQPITLSDLSNPNVVDLKTGYDICYFTFEPQIGSKQYEAVKTMIFKFLDLNNINYLNILRIKFNITPTHDTIKQSPPHSDSKKPHLNFIYYLNDCEGETVLYNEQTDFVNSFSDPTIFKKVVPECGKAIIFDGRHFHAVTPPSKMPLRAVINALISVEDWPTA
jgi:hypothetical protein